MILLGSTLWKPRLWGNRGPETGQRERNHFLPPKCRALTLRPLQRRKGSQPCLHADGCKYTHPRANIHHTTCTHTHVHIHFQAPTCGGPLIPQHPENQVAQGAGGEGRGRAESKHRQPPKCPGHRVRTSRAGAAEGHDIVEGSQVPNSNPRPLSANSTRLHPNFMYYS